LGISGIGCDDFNATVYDLAMDSIVQNSTFSDAGCEQPDESTSFVIISNEVSLPLAIAVRVGSSVHEFVTDVLNQSVVEARFWSSRRELEQPGGGQIVVVLLYRRLRIRVVAQTMHRD